MTKLSFSVTSLAMTDNHSRHVSLVDAIKKGEFAPYADEFRERAAQGDKAAPIALGYMYFRGRDGVRRDYGEALRWFKKVKLEDDLTGLVASHLATIYYKGLGVAKDHRVAAKYLRSAALRGHDKSRVLIAILQRKGDGTLKKPKAAKTILRSSVCNPKLGVVMRFVALVWLYP